MPWLKIKKTKLKFPLKGITNFQSNRVSSTGLHVEGKVFQSAFFHLTSSRRPLQKEEMQKCHSECKRTPGKMTRERHKLRAQTVLEENQPGGNQPAKKPRQWYSPSSPKHRPGIGSTFPHQDLPIQTASSSPDTDKKASSPRLGFSNCLSYACLQTQGRGGDGGNKWDGRCTTPSVAARCP